MVRNCIVLASKVSRRLVSSAPTPDDLDELLSLVWKEPAFFIAHPRAIAAFERECTWRGVPPVTTDLFGTKVILWRGVPIVPSDKVEVEGQYLTGRGVGTTKIILVRVGEKNQGVVGLHQSGIHRSTAPKSCRQSAVPSSPTRHLTSRRSPACFSPLASI